ncbi:MAG: substrate-binding domain-containing protein [Anaerolineales bacterium]
MSIRNFLIVTLLILALAGCQPRPAASPPKPPEILTIALSPILPQQYRTQLLECASDQASVSIILYEPQTSFPDIEDLDGFIWWGPLGANGILQNADTTTVSLGELGIKFFVHPSNPVNNLSPHELNRIFAGQIRHWNDISPQEYDNPISPLSYPRDHPLRTLLDSEVFKNHALTPNALILPHPESMINKIENDPQAIGFAPSHAGSDSVKEISIIPALSSFQQPILGIIFDNENINLTNLFICVQLSLEE